LSNPKPKTGPDGEQGIDEPVPYTVIDIDEPIQYTVVDQGEAYEVCRYKRASPVETTSSSL
jgi:hypothetical protein